MPDLRHVSLSRPILPPSKQIKSESDVENWKKSTGYKDYCLWVVRLNSSVIGLDNETVQATPRSEVGCLPSRSLAAVLLMSIGSCKDDCNAR